MATPLGEGESGERALLTEHALARSEDDGEDQQLVGVYGVVLGETTDQATGAEHDEVTVRLLLDVSDRGGHGYVLETPIGLRYGVVADG